MSERALLLVFSSTGVTLQDSCSSFVASGCALWQNTNNESVKCFRIGVLPTQEWRSYEPPEQGAPGKMYSCFVDSAGECQVAYPGV